MDATLYNIAKSGRVDLLSQVADTNNRQLLLTATPNNNTALHIAARHGHFNFAARISELFPSLLLEENSRGDTALHIAARNGNALLADELIKCADKNGLAEDMLITRNKGLNTALHEAASNHHHCVVESLIRKEPELVLLVNAAGASPLYLAAEEGALECVLGILKTKGLRILQDYYSGPDDRTPVHGAVLRGHLDVVKVLIQELPSLIKQRDSYSNLPLHYAASLGNLEMVRVLLQSDISATYMTDKDGRSPFLVAANNGHVGVIKELLRFCPDSVEVADKKGRNVLHVAVKSGKLEVMKHILKSDDLKELINEPDNEGNTPLHLAVIKRYISVLNLLLKDKRVDMRAINDNGMTALDIAESDKELTMKFRKIVICTALIQAGARRGERLLHTQANRAHAEDITAPRIESYRAMSKTILVVAGLIITVTFAAAFSIPGGYNSDVPDKGLAVLRRRPAFWAFMITDAIALFSSIIVALLLIWAGIGDKDLLVGTVSIATRLMAIALGSLTLAFLSSLWLVVSNWLCIVVLSILILVLSLSLHSFCFQFSLLVLLFKQMILNYLVFPIFNSEKRSAVQPLENMETRHLVRSKYSITNIECLLVDSQPPSAKESAL
eukprot:TRINITY_DN5601_c0_g1_i2.p1 TRINITY_DN5601_c0_g1~~TRINITY_DN5601_c0_g1_i2.p1  ORF type:complete len:614 (+),score=95.00 TRINITY_DN5601_c0_g1_i2:36-1877(+)